MIVDNGKYYLYRHVRLDKNEPFYIGIGTKRERKQFKSYKAEYYRAFDKDRNNFWKSVVNKTDFKVEILIESNDRSFIGDKEKEFISLYGRRDTKNGELCNQISGGIDKPSFLEVRSKRKEIIWNSKKSYLYDANSGQLISSFNTLQEVCKFTNIKDNRVAILCRNKLIYKDFIYSFEYMGELVEVSNFKKRVSNGVAKTVYKFDTVSGKLIDKYKSLSHAAKYIPVSFKAIYQAIVKKGSCYGYYWSYENSINLSEYIKKIKINKWLS